MSNFPATPATPAATPTTPTKHTVAVVAFKDDIKVLCGDPSTAQHVVAIDVSGSIQTNNLVKPLREAAGCVLVGETDKNGQPLSVSVPEPNGRTAIIGVIQAYPHAEKLTIITDGEETVFEGDLQIGDETKNFDPNSENAAALLAEYAASKSGTKFVLLGIGQGAEKTTKAWLNVPNAFVGHIHENSTIRETKAVVDVVKSNARRNKRVTVVTTPSNIQVADLTEQQRLEYDEVITRVVVEGQAASSVITTGQDVVSHMDSVYTETDKKKDVDYKLALEVMKDCSKACAPKDTIGKYGRCNNEGRKTQVNRLLAKLAKSGVLVGVKQDKTPRYKLADNVPHSAVLAARQKYGACMPNPKSKKRKAGSDPAATKKQKL